MKKGLVLLCLGSLFFRCFSQGNVSQFGKTVVFLYVKKDGELKANGTGFLVSKLKETNPTEGFYYLVTAKHVLTGSDKQPLNEIYVRCNTKSDSSIMVRYNLQWSDPEKTVFSHPDTTIDVAVIPFRFNNSLNLDYKQIPSTLIIDRSDYDSFKIDVGTEVFFSGLFTNYIGTRKNQPVFRFGKICLVPNEKVEFDKMKRDILFIESSTFGGNSGSPVIFKVKNKDLKEDVRLGGIVLGSFQSGKKIGEIEKEGIIDWNNVGISAITPSEFILDVLNLPELVEQRNKN